MISQQFTEELLGIALSTGADFAEIFAEQTRNQSIRYQDRKIETIGDNTLCGVGIRAFLGTNTVYASSSGNAPDDLRAAAASVAAAVGEVKHSGVAVPPLCLKQAENKHPVILPPSCASMRDRCDLLRAGCLAAYGVNSLIAQVSGTLFSCERSIWIANSEGLFVNDSHTRCRMAISAVAQENGENQTGSYSPGAGMGLEFFEKISPEEIGKRAANQAVVNIKAGYAPAGVMPVAIENGFGGVIFHEACGHSLEATSVAVGLSQMAGKIGQKIAGDKVTAVDDGTIVGAWGSSNIDDEGNPTQRNVLIENGILKGYMVDRLGSRRMGMPMTGSSRRENYAFEPTSRMTNTFIENGPDKNEDIIASMEYGLYAKSMGGGSVNPLTGDFNFAVNEGYIVRNGKICEAVRGASLVGTGADVLLKIDMVGQNLDRGQGMCGSSSGSIPVDVGQPLIRISAMTVGGRN